MVQESKRYKNDIKAINLGQVSLFVIGGRMHHISILIKSFIVVNLDDAHYES